MNKTNNNDQLKSKIDCNVKANDLKINITKSKTGKRDPTLTKHIHAHVFKRSSFHFEFHFKRN